MGGRTKKRWRRRDFLRAAGIGASAAMLPLVPDLGAAQPTTRPRRLILLQTGNGTILDRWREGLRPGALPPLTGPILSPLDRHRESLLLLDGIDIAANYAPGGTWPESNAGHAGASVLWTGVSGGGTDFGDHGQYPTGPSVDQVIAEHIGASSPHASLQLGVFGRPLDPRSVYSFDRSGVPLPAERNPQAVFDRVFGGGPVEPSDSERLVLGEVDVPGDRLPTDHTSGPFASNDQVPITQRDVDVYAEVARLVAANTMAGTRDFLPCAEPDLDCLEATVDALLPRFLRRPPDDATRDAYLGLARDTFAADGFEDALSLWLETVLQSPSFLRDGRALRDATVVSVRNPAERGRRR